MFSETASHTGTYDIAMDSAWCEGGHWPIISQFSGYGADFQAKNQLQSDMEEISVLLQFDKLLAYQWKMSIQNSKCFFFSIINSELNFVKFWILDSGELAGACAMHELQNLGKGLFY